MIMNCSNFSRLTFFIVLFMDVVVIEGLIKCHYCNSEEGPCRTDTMEGTRPQKCTRWFYRCSLYRGVFANGTTAQVVRGCDRDCEPPSVKWTLQNLITTHCKFCCDSDFCNAHLGNPCGGPSILMASNTTWLIVLVSLLGLCTN